MFPWDEFKLSPNKRTQEKRNLWKDRHNGCHRSDDKDASITTKYCITAIRKPLISELPIRLVGDWFRSEYKFELSIIICSPKFLCRKRFCCFVDISISSRVGWLSRCQDKIEAPSKKERYTQYSHEMLCMRSQPDLRIRSWTMKNESLQGAEI